MVKLPKGMGGAAKIVGGNLLELTYTVYLYGRDSSKDKVLNFREFAKDIRTIHVKGQQIRKRIRNDRTDVSGNAKEKSS